MPHLRCNGTSLFYEDSGDGSPTMLLIHPYGGDHTYLAPQREFFGGRYRVVAVDLRGHGGSDKPEGDYGIATHADDLAGLCRDLGLGEVVLVGNSMGGMVALEIAARHPGLTSAVVLLDSPVVTPPGMLDAFLPYIEALRTPAYGEVTRQVYSTIVGFPDDERSRERILSGLASNAQHVMISAMEAVLAYDSDAAAARCGGPLLYVSSGPWYTDVARFRELCPQLVTGQVVGSGHFLQLEVPEQVNPMIDRFLTLHLPRRPLPA